MEKDPPPPYSPETTGGVHPLPGFNAPVNQAPIQAGYPPQPGYPPAPQPGYPPAPQPGYPPAQQPGHIPAGQAAYFPPPQGGNTTVVVNTAPPAFGPIPQPTACPHCHKQIVTRLETEAGTKTHLIALLLCIVGCIPCCLIPYCVDSCQNRHHYCPSCGAFLGAYNDVPNDRRW